MSDRMKCVLAMITYLTGMAIFYGWAFSGNKTQAASVTALICGLVGQASAVYAVILVKRSEP